MAEKFVSTSFHCALAGQVVDKKKGFFKKRIEQETLYYPEQPDCRDYGDRLAREYNKMDAAGYKVVNVIPINFGCSEPVYKVDKKSGVKRFIGEKTYSITRGAVVIGERCGSK